MPPNLRTPRGAARRLPLALLLLAAAAGAGGGDAAGLVRYGGASFLDAPPLGVGAIDPPVEDIFRTMRTRPLYMTRRNAGKPIPTNDWWTDALVSQWTGNLWSYPAKVRIGDFGVRVAFPSHWIDDGTEVRERSAVFVRAADPFAPEAAKVDDWHDWDVSFLLEDGRKVVRATLVHGSPFTWVEARGTSLRVVPEALENQEAKTERMADGGELIAIGNDLYGVWRGKKGEVEWVAVGLLPDKRAYATLSPYAPVVIRETRVDWKLDLARSEVATLWRVKAEDLRNGFPNPVALQGFQPHHLRNTRVGFKCVEGLEWLTPRGKQRVAAGNSLVISYPFHGVLPYWPAPGAPRAAAGADPGAQESGAYSPGLFRDLITDYATRGTFGHDTYWGGKGLLQMAFAMMAARETGAKETFELARANLRETLEDWLTYESGEPRRFFAFMPRWGGLVGIAPSYGSEIFNDHHFHYGYFTYSGALLCMVDDDFARKYGPMLRLLAKDYANWERGDPLFPFLRTFDPWAGHSFAGGLGDGNGNGQESSSEAMQGWGGMLLLGLALGDAEMTAAAAFGYAVESRATAEYWFDRNRDNIDYTKFRHPYNSNLTCHGVGWWTYFSGDPVWMHSIQWLPNTPALDYLSEDLKFAKWDWETMWETKEAGGWFEKGRDAAGNETGPVGDASLGNVLLSYLQRHDPRQAARIFAELRERGSGAAVNPDTAHMTYWAIHSHLNAGELDFSVRADYPAARAYVRDGRRAYAVYNFDSTPRTVGFFDRGGRKVASVLAAPRAMTFSRDGAAPVVSPIGASLATGAAIPPPQPLSNTLLQQSGDPSR